MGAFEQHPGFYQQDLRKYREHNKTTLAALEAKCLALLPEPLIRGRTILDLGSCLGAMGQWALHYGAAHYKGVELQAEFVDLSKSLLSHWGERATVQQQGIREYLFDQPDDAVDIIVAAGILQTFIDPHTIIMEMCRVARKAVVVEASLPSMVRKGQVGFDANILQFSNAACNLAGGHHQMRGVSAKLTKKATDWLFSLNGFEPARYDISPQANSDTHMFTVPLPGEKTPLRFFERYKPSYNGTKPKKLLEASLKDGSGTVQLWKDSKLCRKFKRNNTLDQIKPWVFDQKVADAFDQIAEKNIPDYRRVIELCVHVISELKIPNPRIIDVGCATGNTLKRLNGAGFRNLVGVDSSRPMLDKIKNNRAELIHSDTFPKQAGPYDVVLANWTLHFIEEREAYLQAIADSLTDHGILFLTEKTQSSMLVQNLYKDFKRKKGLSDQEIESKEQQLKGVLVSYSVNWYLDTLHKLGFSQVGIVNSRYGFVSFLAQR